MPYLPELHYCCKCGVYLGMDDGDGICYNCDTDEDDMDVKVPICIICNEKFGECKCVEEDFIFDD